MDRAAYGYASLPQLHNSSSERHLRAFISDCAQEHGVLLRNVFVDFRDESPYAFAALRELLRRRRDVRALVLPDLTHVAHLATIGSLSHAGLARYLGVAVLVATPTPGPVPRVATVRRDSLTTDRPRRAEAVAVSR
jgi:hypothetical protein